MSQSIREKAEALLSSQFPVEEVLNDADLPKILHELRVHQVELELQNKELQETQAHLRQAQKKYLDLYNLAPVGYFTLDNQGLIIDVNLVGSEILKRERRHLIGKPLMVYFSPSSRQTFFEHLNLVFQSKARQQCELEFETLRGQRTHVQMTSTAVFENDRWLSYCVIADITAQKAAQAAIATEKTHLNSTLLAINDGVIATDTHGRITLLNEIAEALTGWSRRNATGRQLDEVFRLFNNETRQPYPNPALQVLTTEKPFTGQRDDILVDVNKNEYFVDTSCAPIRLDENSPPLGTILVFRDVTRQHNIEAELLKAQKLESISVLAGGIAHDFNNLLTGIMGNIGLSKLELSTSSEPYKRLDEAEHATTRAKELTQQLLTFARGGNPIKKTASIRDLITKSVHFAMRGANVQAEIDIPPDLWNADIDQGQINQVLHNLVINALQAMPDGGQLRVTAENVGLPSQTHIPLSAGQYIKISVQDEGVGISPQHLSRVFDPYFTTKHSGNGLGLATSYAIIEKHEGYITANSEVGQGSNFTFYLPASQKKAQNNAIPDVNRPINGQGRLLVLDDDQVVIDVLQRVLKSLGYECVFVEDGQTAIATYRMAHEGQVPFDAVLMDLVLPGGMDGLETLQHLRKIDPQVRAIISSGYANSPLMTEYAEHGFLASVAKPYRISELSQTLSQVVNSPAHPA